MIKEAVVLLLGSALLVAGAPSKVKRSPQIPSPPGMPPMPSPPMPPGMLDGYSAATLTRIARQAPEEVPEPNRFARQAPEEAPEPPSRVARQAPEDAPAPSKRVARQVAMEADGMPKKITQESFYSSITTINRDRRSAKAGGARG